MGANDIAKEGGWQWQESGESLTYSNWNTGEPNNHGHVEDCGTLVGGQGFWNDMPCSTKLMFICEMEAAPPTVSPTQPPTKVTPESTPMASTIDNDNLAEDKSSYNICSCRCKLFAGKPLNITSDDLNVMMARTRQELTVDKRRTSLFNRTKLSIEDRRLSSQVLGFFGASILTLLFICIALPDLLACLRSIYSKRLHHQHCQYL
ncbi:C-type mannose receptor 2-like [Pecten maximus]|uniref:C-type mannose receptor 2-like n=1 Tax=Pecten maximus TaxID=6579 RepID=UPI0014585FDB|nr:C-type mannose receptor 2-like [Pecten maximus]